jgi:hypothetical protein
MSQYNLIQIYKLAILMTMLISYGLINFVMKNKVKL